MVLNYFLVGCPCKSPYLPEYLVFSFSVAAARSPARGRLILLAKILAPNKSAFCRIGSLAFSFILISNLLSLSFDRGLMRIGGTRGHATGVAITLACEQALLFGRVKRVSRKRASEGLACKRFQSSYYAKVRAEAKKRLKGEGEGRRGKEVPSFPSPSPVIQFFLPLSQLSRRTSRGNACYAGW